MKTTTKDAISVVPVLPPGVQRKLIEIHCSSLLGPFSLLEWLHVHEIVFLKVFLDEMHLSTLLELRDVGVANLRNVLVNAAVIDGLVERVCSAVSALALDWDKVVPIEPCSGGHRTAKGVILPLELSHCQTVHALQGSTIHQ